MGVSLFFDHILLADGWAQSVKIRGDGRGEIVQLEVGASGDGADYRYRVGLPGLTNLHSHAFQRAMAGLTEVRACAEDSFWTWRERMYHFVRQLDPEHVLSIAALAYMEMLESGFTRVCEFHYLHHDKLGEPYADRGQMCAAVLAASVETGIAMTLLPVFYAYGGFGAQPASQSQRRFVTDVDGYAKLWDAAARHTASVSNSRIGVALHSLRAVHPRDIGAVTAMAPQGPWHIHVAEQPKEVADCVQWCGTGPVQWLVDHTPLDSRWCVVHATHMTPEERQGLASSRAVAGVCPITEANLGDGIFDAVHFVKDGGVLGVGSDSNGHIDAAAELCMLEYTQRLRDGARNRLVDEGSTGRALFQHALRGGACAGAVASDISVGASLDFMTLDTSHPSMLSSQPDQWLDGWIFSAARGAIEDVWVAGLRQVNNGRHVARELLASRYRDTVSTLLSL